MGKEKKEYELMTFIDICAGIGGFRAGMEQAGNAVTVNVIKAIGERMEEDI